ncbi:hypothetical protein ACX27_02260 [Nostoc piscinale CENA21]|uniref:Pycsar effector protein domain-containing protein n=1 Tax=Nostoc piscinale CENA21 TaxID=224013 RepID=A0A0M3V4D4_9NOSO|nr:hypothetical protein [Nostoc piscinale]ALF51943.1 hypothetical protein ACX27_02260 [Nostoc piscinale CENA21]
MDEITNKLLVIFQNVNEWLKFAEAKNAVLLAFSGAGMTATITVLATVETLPNSLRIGLLLTTSLLCISALICSLSFIPKTNLERLLWVQTMPERNSTSAIKDTDNFYFFGDLQKYNSQRLLAALNNYYFDNTMLDPFKKEYKDIASQITINARITFLKFRIFTYAVYLLIISILMIPCLLLVSLAIYRTL